MGDCEHIFIMEDHLGVRKAVCDLIEENGHTIVAVTSSSHEAKVVINNPEVKFGVAILDASCSSPGDGADVAEYLRLKRPDTTIFSLSNDPQDFGDYNLNKMERRVLNQLVETLKSL